jgi:sigma-B regulation protein RsbU (phosphoserine phosphatase)
MTLGNPSSGYLADGADGTDSPRRWTGSAVDLAHSPRVRLLVEMAQTISRAGTADELLIALNSSMRKIYGPRRLFLLSVADLPEGWFQVVRLIDFAGRLEGVDDDVVLSKPAFGGFFGDVIRTPFPKLFHDLIIPDDPVFGDRLSECRTMEIAPVFSKGNLAGWVGIGSREPRAFDVVDVEQSILRSNLVIRALDTLERADEAKRARREMDREVDRIAAIQRALLPQRIPAIRGIVGAADFRTFDRAGGDYYTLLPLDHGESEESDAGRWAVLIADASGHGPAAAVLIAMLHATLLARPLTRMTAAEVLAYLNRQLLRRPIDGSFVTAFFGVIDPAAGTIEYACAGHPPPLDKSPGSYGAVTRLNAASGLPLGVVETANYDFVLHRWAPGHTIVMYTDGVTEATSPSGRMFGIRGVERACTECTGEPDCIVGSLRFAVEAFEAGSRPTDDQTILVLQRRP